MAFFNWPAYGSDKAFWPASIEPRQVHNNRLLESDLSGDVQTSSVPGAKWGWALNFGRQYWDERARLWAFLTRLNGMEHRVRLFDAHLPRPSGTCALSGVTAAAAVAQFATNIVLSGCGSGKTLLPGDWLNIGGTQLVQTVVAATANGAGSMSVEFRHLLRAPVAAGASIVLDQPTGLYILTTSELGTAYGTGNQAPELTVEFREVFA